MRVLPVLISGALLAGCATISSDSGGGETAAHQAMTEAFRSQPETEPIPLAPLSPATRLQSEVEAMSHADLASWILPEADARRVVKAALHRNRMSQLGGISFSLAPQPTEMPGLCEVRGWTAFLRVPNESSLTHEQYRNPPLLPYQYLPTILWKVVGSTEAPAAGKGAECASALTGGAWFQAPSAEAAYGAVNLVEQAQSRPDRVRIVCTQMGYDEAQQRSIYPRCPNPAALLKQLTPDLIKRVRPADCTDETGASPRGCLGIEYQDPAKPGTYSFYTVNVAGDPRLRSIHIVQGMLPPH